MVFKPSFKCLKNKKTNFSPAILKLETLLYKKIYILFHLILYSQSDFDSKKKRKWSKRKKTCQMHDCLPIILVINEWRSFNCKQTEPERAARAHLCGSRRCSFWSTWLRRRRWRPGARRWSTSSSPVTVTVASRSVMGSDRTGGSCTDTRRTNRAAPRFSEWGHVAAECGLAQALHRPLQSGAAGEWGDAAQAADHIDLWAKGDDLELGGNHGVSVRYVFINSNVKKILKNS